MRNFKIILNLYWHYMTCLRGMNFFFFSGIFFLVFGLSSLISSTGAQNWTYRLLTISLLLLLVFPFVTTGMVFRQLGSNSQLALAGNAIRLAFITMFIFTLLITLLPWFLLPAFGRDINAGQVIWIFFGASLHLLITQLSLHRQAMQGYQFLPVLALVFFPQINTEKWHLLFVPALTWPLLLVTATGWVWSFGKIFHTLRLAPNNFCSTLNLNSLDRKAFARNSLSLWVQAKTSNRAGESVFYDMLMNNRVLFTRQALLIIVMPVVMALCFLLLSGPNSGTEGPSLPGLILLISLFPAILCPFSLAEIMPRSKLLWLKSGRTRSDIWKLMESYIVRELACTWILTSLLAGLGIFSGVISPANAGAYIILIACCSTFFVYYPLYFRLDTDLTANAMLIFGLVSANITVFLVVINAVITERPESLFVLSFFMLIIGVKFRFAARQSFKRIDWLKIRPRKLNNGRKIFARN